MNVRDLMTWEVRTCHPDTDLGSVAMMLWDQDCGIVPVVERETNRLLGVVTDRDICMAAATKNRAPAAIAVSEILGGTPRRCFPDDALRTAMDVLAGAKVHRLPVVDAEGILKGILSLNDLILASGPAGKHSHTAVHDADVMRVLRAVSKHRQEQALVTAG